jgi:hypothetical protein
MDPLKAGKVLKYIILGSLAIAMLVLVVFAVLVHHTAVIRRSPLRFLAETVLIAALGSLPIYYVASNRMASMQATTIGFAILFAKFVVFWVLLELAGVNEIAFPPRGDTPLSLIIIPSSSGARSSGK